MIRINYYESERKDLQYDNSFFSKNTCLKVLLHALHYTVFDYSNIFFLKEKEKKRSFEATKKKRKRDVCDNLPGYTLLSLSMNAVDSELTIGRE